MGAISPWVALWASGCWERESKLPAGAAGTQAQGSGGKETTEALAATVRGDEDPEARGGGSPWPWARVTVESWPERQQQQQPAFIRHLLSSWPGCRHSAWPHHQSSRNPIISPYKWGNRGTGVPYPSRSRGWWRGDLVRLGYPASSRSPTTGRAWFGSQWGRSGRAWSHFRFMVSSLPDGSCHGPVSSGLQGQVQGAGSRVEG